VGASARFLCPRAPLAAFRPQCRVKPSPAFEGETEAVKEDYDGDDVAEVDGGGDDDDDDGIVCAVCQSTDGDPSDPIVFCDGCDLMVHATCYGNPLCEGYSRR
jgi:hypothetical protein